MSDCSAQAKAIRPFVDEVNLQVAEILAEKPCYFKGYPTETANWDHAPERRILSGNPPAEGIFFQIRNFYSKEKNSIVIMAEEWDGKANLLTTVEITFIFP